jgi:hypothetical protein
MTQYIKHFIAMFLLWGLAGYIAPPSYASMIDSDTLRHRVVWSGLYQSSPLAQEANGIYQQFSSVSLDGQNHGYLRDKYKPKYFDMGIGFTTTVFASEKHLAQITTNFTTGQPSEKLTVAPSMQLGMKFFHILQERAQNTWWLSWGASAIFGGQIKEKACSDDYDRAFNCRSAQSVVDSPLINKDPYNKYQLGIQMGFVGDFF